MKIVVIFAFLGLLTGCGNPCSNKVVSNLTSPDGKYEATAFIRDCGATTDFSPQVYLRPKGQSCGSIGNVFIGDHSDQIEVQWLSSTQLVIQSTCTVMMLTTNYEGIVIRYERPK